MNIWLKRALVWGIPGLFVALYGAVWLTNENLATFFDHTAWGSKLYANIWVHMLQGNSLIDPQYANGEYFIVAADHIVTYFGVMPAFIRAIADIFMSDVYAVSLTNFSMVLALLVTLGSVGYAVKRLAKASKNALIIGIGIIAALLFASPISYLLVWSWTYHEVIMWGVAWATLFVSIFSVWVFDPKHVTRWHGALMGVAVGMAMLSRPTVGLMLAVPFAFLLGRATFLRFRSNKATQFNLLWPGAIACAVLALVVMVVNYQRWGSPFTFVKIDRNVQFVELYPERATAINKAGEFNINRVPTSLFYYTVPSGGNLKSSFPFVTLDSELKEFNKAPQYDYIEGSRLPITVSALLFLVLAGFGIYGFRTLKKEEKLAGYWLLGGAAVSVMSLLMVYAVSLRYTAEFMPVLVFLALVYVVALQRKAVPAPGKKTWAALGSVAIVALYITFVATVQYKQFVWDVPMPAREKAAEFIKFTPTDRDTKHIINGVRFPEY